MRRYLRYLPTVGLIAAMLLILALSAETRRLRVDLEEARRHLEPSFSRETMAQWNRIVTEVVAESRGEVEVYGISFDSAAVTLAYIADHAVPYPVLLAEPEARVPELYRAPGVPLTLVLDSARVVHVRFGSLAQAPAAVDSIVQLALRGSFSGEN